MKLDAIGYRILVELGGLNRAATVREVWGNLGGMDSRWDPLQVETALDHLNYVNLVKSHCVTDLVEPTYWTYKITWQGVEALRKHDADANGQTAKIPAVRRKPWLLRSISVPRGVLILFFLAWFAVGVAWGWRLG